MKCPKCDFDIISKVKFCPYCGHELSKPYEREDLSSNEDKKESVEDLVNVFDEVKEEKKENSTNYDYSDNMYDMKDIEENKVIALFSYLSFLFLIPLLAKPDSKYCKFHVNQGIILCIVNAIVKVISEVLGIINISVGINGVINLVITVLDLLITGLTIYGVYNAVTGNAKELPVIGKYKILK